MRQFTNDELLTSSDAGRLIDRVPATIRAAARAGNLRVAATTRSGVRLYRVSDVLVYQRKHCREAQRTGVPL